MGEDKLIDRDTAAHTATKDIFEMIEILFRAALTKYFIRSAARHLRAAQRRADLAERIKKGFLK